MPFTAKSINLPRNKMKGDLSSTKVYRCWALVSFVLHFAVTSEGFSFVARTRAQQKLQGPLVPCRNYKVATQNNKKRVPSASRLVTMRDRSEAYWFQVGDTVQVIENVQKAGTNLKGRKGTVVETWEKCDVDPTCCCAEQVDPGMAVHVSFAGDNKDSFVHYFAEEELTKVEPEKNDATIAFDGMSCTEFKLQQLQVRKQAQRIASFEASRKPED